MAFQKSNVIYGRGGSNNYASPQGLITHTYASSTDSMATIAGASYFSDFIGATSEDVKINDLLTVRDSANNFQTYKISSVSPVTLASISLDTETGSFIINLTGGFTGVQPQTVNYVKTGQIVTLRFAFASHVQTGAANVTTGPDIPVALRTPTPILNGSRIVLDNATDANFKEAYQTDGSITFTPTNAATFSGTGAITFHTGNVTYTL